MLRNIWLAFKRPPLTIGAVERFVFVSETPQKQKKDKNGTRKRKKKKVNKTRNFLVFPLTLMGRFSFDVQRIRKGKDERVEGMGEEEIPGNLESGQRMKKMLFISSLTPIHFH